MLEYTALCQGRTDGTYGLLDPEYGRINGHLTLFFDLSLFVLSEFFEFIADREKQDERLDGLGNEVE
jgi:hypothetical protein